jgi:hypothetical protein
VSTLEASGIMKDLTQELLDTPQLVAQYLKAHQLYLQDREKIQKVSQISQISAGGMPSRVKCLHALLAHTLAAGPHINPIGDRVVELLQPTWSIEVCRCH